MSHTCRPGEYVARGPNPTTVLLYCPRTPEHLSDLQRERTYVLVRKLLGCLGLNWVSSAGRTAYVVEATLARDFGHRKDLLCPLSGPTLGPQSNLWDLLSSTGSRGRRYLVIFVRGTGNNAFSERRRRRNSRLRRRRFRAPTRPPLQRLPSPVCRPPHVGEHTRPPRGTLPRYGKGSQGPSQAFTPLSRPSTGGRRCEPWNKKVVHTRNLAWFYARTQDPTHSTTTAPSGP